MTDNHKTELGVMHADLRRYDSGDVTNRELIKRRASHLAGSVLFYDNPVWIVRGEGPWLYDHDDHRYLDCYNNVPSVGHCNPRVVNAIAEQSALLNTHTRYLHETIIEYAEALAGTFPDPLDMCYFVCTGTEANELAMRIARSVTGQRGAIVMEGSYHGNSTLISELSTMTYSRKDTPGHVAAVEPPNLYRGSSSDPASYVDAVDDAIAQLEQSGEGVAAYLCDAMFDSQGGLEAPGNYFTACYEKVRAAGGLCIADEVQPGFGRTGKMWGFENYDVVPDIVTLGKPMGNGHPVAGVVTTRDIADRFAAATPFYFNTFGGNPVAAAAGLAVLRELEANKLPAAALHTGRYLRRGLARLADRFESIGNVHGLGLYQALDLVTDRETREPATSLAKQIPDLMREQGVLIGLSGRYGNVLKIRPPLVFGQEHADILLDALNQVFSTVTTSV